MTSPLQPVNDASLNSATPPTTKKRSSMHSETNTPSKASRGSSPLATSVSARRISDQENLSPSKTRHSRIMSGNELSPLKILTGQREPSHVPSPDQLAPPATRSPRKVSPERRFPIKVSNPIEATRQSHERTMSLDAAVQENPGLKRAIEIFEDDDSGPDDNEDIESDDVTAKVNVEPPNEVMDVDESALPDDSMISTFSTFSAVPNLTTFAQLGQSPSKFSNSSGPSSRGRQDPSPSRTPRPMSLQEGGNTTNLLDFTASMRFPQRESLAARRDNPSPSRNPPNVAATPSRNMSNLIDFDIPPMPTPRSVPSITPRELESLKSKFLSEISSLKASLSGKEAEVQSLKTAVGDAEKRVGETMEQLREEQSDKEQLASEWENRGREMENVLRKAKEEIVMGQRERDELEQKLDESEKRREAAEMMHQEAESKMAGMRAGKDMDKSSPEKVKSPGASSTHEVEVAVERVARELHGLYKSKHETKVAALKKSYETRWEKKINQLESRIAELSEENEKLRAGRDATIHRVESDSAETEERKAQAVRDSAAIKELNAEIQRLEAVINTVQQDNEDLRRMLEQERVEKGELVQLAEEMMNMQSFAQSQPQPQPEREREREYQAQPQQSMQQPQYRQERPESKTPQRGLGSFRSSVGRGSGLKAPGAGLRAPHERNQSRPGGLPRPGGIPAPRSGIMSSIEKMGNYRGRAGE